MLLMKKSVERPKDKSINQMDRTFWQEVWRRFKKNRSAVIALYFVIIITTIAFLTLIIDFATNKEIYNHFVINQDMANRFQSPSIAHLFGLDEFGRDMLFRMIWAIRYSIFLGTVAVAIAASVGIFLGAIAGYYGKILDNIIMRIMDVLLAIPQILLAIAIVAALGTSLVNLLIAVAISYIPGYARLVRASVLSVKDQEYVEAVRALGASDYRILFIHILPNAMAPAIVQASLGVAWAILALAAMSFIGLGIQPPAPEWGAMLSSARAYIRESWHMTVIPGLGIATSVLAFNLIGDGLRDALDPRLKN